MTRSSLKLYSKDVTDIDSDSVDNVALLGLELAKLLGYQGL